MQTTSPLLVALFLLALPLALVSGDVVSRGPVNEHIYVAAPSTGFFSKFARQSAATSMWQISYDGAQPPSYVQAAVQYATELVSKYFEIKYPIRAQFSFQPLGTNTAGNTILGQARSAVWWPVVNASGYYESLPIALANTLAGKDNLADWSAPIDIVASFNSDAPFYYANDDSRPPSGQFDFVTVLLHELLHGMGFIGGFSCNTPCNGDYPQLNVPYVFKQYLPPYDLRIVNGNGERLSDVWNLRGSLGLAEYYASAPTLYLRTDDGTDSDVELFVPHPFLNGNSIYHLAEHYSGGDSLMRYAIAAEDVIHALGPNTLNVMKAVGWKLTAEAPSISTSSAAAYMPSFLLLLAVALTLELYFLYLA